MRKLSMFNIEPFLNISHCPNCSHPIKPNTKCESCKSFAFFNKLKAVSFYSNSASCLVSYNQMIDYFDFVVENFDSSKSIKPIVQSTFNNHNPNIQLIFNYINKINTFQ